jgi:hypothetical protein
MKSQLCLLVFCLLCNCAIAKQESSITAIGFASHPAVVKNYLSIVKKAYAKIGINPDFIPVSDRRSIKMLSEAKLDGLVIRGQKTMLQHPGFITVPPMLGAADIRLICQPKLLCNKSLLDDSSKILGLVGQDEYYQELLNEKTINTYEVVDYQRMEKMFQQKKLDAMIMVFDLHTQGIPSPELNTYHLEQIEGFHIIHKRFSHLVPKLSKALEESLAEHDFIQE